MLHPRALVRRPSPFTVAKSRLETLESRLLCSTVSLADYLPLGTNITWHFSGDDNGTPFHRNDDLDALPIDGTTAFGVMSGTGERLYFSLDATGLSLHRIVNNPNDSVFIVNTGNTHLLPAVVTIGEIDSFSGAITINDKGVVTPASGNGTTNVVGFENVTVPAGTFNALKIVLTLHAVVGSTTANTSDTFWLVQGLGPVQVLTVSNHGASTTSQLDDSPQTHTFLNHIYLDALNRTPDSGSNALYAAIISSGVQSSQSIASAIINSTEHRTMVIQGLYQSILSRNADTDGLNAWLSAFAQGHTIEELKAQFYGSDEYFNTHGGSNNGLVDAFYVAFLHRHAEPSGLAYWTNLLDHNANRSQIALDVESTSQEGAQDIATHAYQTYLLRGPDSQGLAFWTAQIQSGVSETVIIIGFLGSQEYFTRA